MLKSIHAEKLGHICAMSYRNLAVDVMRDNYRAADNAAKDGRLKQAAQHLESAEKWRIRARNHGAKV